MRPSPRNRSTLLAAFATCAAAPVLFLSPPGVQTAVRGAVLDAIGPSQAWVFARYESGRQLVLAQAMRFRLSSTSSAPTVAPDADERVVALEQACRRLRLENARLR